jgi:hypothetical protein
MVIHLEKKKKAVECQACNKKAKVFCLSCGFCVLCCTCNWSKEEIMDTVFHYEAKCPKEPMPYVAIGHRTDWIGMGL